MKKVLTIPYLPLASLTALHAEAVGEALQRVAASGFYLLGREVATFEAQWAQYVGCTHCVACGNGLDALTLMLTAAVQLGLLHEGDEVAVPANTFVATFLAITRAKLQPLPIDVSPTTCQMDAEALAAALTPRTRAVMLVHLYGRVAWTDALEEVIRERQLWLFEDCAQSAGAVVTVQGVARPTGSLGLAAAHSFYPTKNLGAMGDAGAVTTCHEGLAERVRQLANYGQRRKYHNEFLGVNSRMDELQAAVLCAKLPHLAAENERRRAWAARLASLIHHPAVRLPHRDLPAESAACVWHIFPVFCAQRDALQQHLERCGIGTQLHYPVPPHQQPCYASLAHLHLPVAEELSRTELSLPLHPALSDEEVQRIAEAVNSF